jgi:ABC-type antimicrobial peptide transport system permease subunit
MHYKLYSAINILGLAISLTGVIIISRYVYNELSADSFNSELDRIHIVKHEELGTGNQIFMGNFLPQEMHIDLELLNHSGVEKCASMINFDNIEVSVNDYLYTADVKVIDSVFMRILNFPLVAGRNIVGPEDALITESFAQKTFGNKYPVGEKIFYPTIAKELTVVGVVGKTKHKSSVSFDVAISNQISPFWGRSYQCFILLYPGVNYKDINKLYSEYKKVRIYKEKVRYQLFPYKDIYFDNVIDKYSTYRHGNYMYIFILSAVGGLLLLTAIINYVNIHAVIIRRRSREFGMKKVFGAGGLQIFMQLLCENLIVTVLAVIIALSFTELLTPFVTNTMRIEQFPNPSFDFTLSMILAFVFPLIASVTPYIRYHYSTPLKSLQAVGAGNKSLLSSRFYLCFQYFITMVMIVASLFFIKQLNFMLDYDLGYRTENIIKVPVHRDGMLGAAVQIKAESKSLNITELYQKLAACTFLEHWTNNGKSPNSAPNTVDMKVTPKDDIHKVHVIGGDKKWFNIFDFHLIDGRMWEDEERNVVIVSESLLKQLGITDYKDTELGFPTWGYKVRIVGVVKDFCITRLSEKQYPVVISPEHYFGSSEYITASFLPGRKQDVIKFMQDLHKEVVGGEFSYSFVSDEVAGMYENDKRIAIICSLLTGFAIFVSALGLFGISLFDIRRRRKEIAIRKINGAQIIDIIRLLLKKYFLVLSIAFAVSIPVALFAIHKYLENFAYKTSISWWLFAVALVVTVIVSMATMLYQIYKAGNENPSEVIKSQT